MAKNVYEELAAALDRLPNGFPRTPSGVELEILRLIFSPDEASLASQLGRTREPYNEIAARIGITAENAKSRLLEMAKRGLVWMDVHEHTHRFRLAPWVVGIYEAQLERMDHQFAHLVEEYFAQGGAEGIMRPQPPLHRVIPVQGAVKSEWILPYDDVKAMLAASKVFGVRRCICRVQQDYLGRKCDFPVDICLNFSSRERSPRAGDITKEEALLLLDKVEELGLVHTVSNVMEGYHYVCNCCGCCCGILRGITDFGIEDSVAYSNYYSIIDSESCIGCGRCTDRCHVDAIMICDQVAVVNRKQCIGCGLCVTGCPTGAAQLQLKPHEEIVQPPFNYEAWELQRLQSRE